jgi:hypothetical protein
MDSTEISFTEPDSSEEQTQIRIQQVSVSGIARTIFLTAFVQTSRLPSFRNTRRRNPNQRVRLDRSSLRAAAEPLSERQIVLVQGQRPAASRNAGSFT